MGFSYALLPSTIHRSPDPKPSSHKLIACAAKAALISNLLSRRRRFRSSDLGTDEFFQRTARNEYPAS
jgi:hypothetical protein